MENYTICRYAVEIPRYKLKLSNGTTDFIEIYPETNESSKGEALGNLDEALHPCSTLILKRIEEYRKAKGVDVISADAVENRTLWIKELFAGFLRLNYFIQTIVMYLFLGVIRFPFWAFMIFRGK